MRFEGEEGTVLAGAGECGGWGPAMLPGRLALSPAFDKQKLLAFVVHFVWAHKTFSANAKRTFFNATSFLLPVFSFQQLAVFRGPVFPHLRLLAVVALFASCHTAQLVHVALHFARFLGLGFGRVRGGGALDWDIVSYSEKRLSGSGRVKLVTKLVSGWRWQKANEKPATGHSSISVYLAIRSEATPTGPRRMVLCWLKQAQQSLLHVWFLKESQTQMVQGSIYNENL